jgi:hypothetical protein
MPKCNRTVCKNEGVYRHKDIDALYCLECATRINRECKRDFFNLIPTERKVIAAGWDIVRQGKVVGTVYTTHHPTIPYEAYRGEPGSQRDAHRVMTLEEGEEWIRKPL